MRITLLLTGYLLTATLGLAQEAATDRLPPPPPNDTILVPRPTDSDRPSADDPVGRIESRLDRIERQLGAQNDRVVETERPMVRDPVVIDSDNSRFRYQGGVWWYWLPSNRWVYWSNGTWLDYHPETVPVYRSAAPAYSYYAPAYTYRTYYPYAGSYYPYGGHHHGHWGSAIGLGLSIGHGFAHHGGHGGGHHFGGHHGGHFGGHHGGGHHGGGHHGGHH